VEGRIRARTEGDEIKPYSSAARTMAGRVYHFYGLEVTPTYKVRRRHSAEGGNGTARSIIGNPVRLRQAASVFFTKEQLFLKWKNIFVFVLAVGGAIMLDRLSTGTIGNRRMRGFRRQKAAVLGLCLFR